MPAKSVYKPGDHAPRLDDQLEERLRVLAERVSVAMPDPRVLLDRVRTKFLMDGRSSEVDREELLFDRALGVMEAKPLPAESLADHYLNLRTAMTIAALSSPNPAVQGISNARIGQLLDARLLPAVREVVSEQFRNQPTVNRLPFRPDYLVTHVADPNPLAAGFLADNPASGTFQPTLSAPQQTELSQSLAGLAALKQALQGALGTDDRSKRAALPRWFDPEHMEIMDSDEGEDVDDSASKLLTRRDRPQAAKLIGAAFTVVANLTELAVLSRLPMPTFLVAKSKAAKDVNVRASTESLGVRITVDQNNDLSVCVHEFGHVIENYAPVGLWLDLQRLLHARHATAGDNTLEQIPRHPKEACYRAAMPAYPHYSAKVYGGWGATEVVSTTVELLSQPAGAKRLLKDDPQVAAIVLRWLSPADFIRTVPAKLHSIALPTAYQ
jgi:hypothetical protein